MSTHHTLPHWLIQATESESYLEDAWAILAEREHQRALARLASRSRRSHRVGFRNPHGFDSSLLHHYSVSVGLSSSNKIFNRYLDVVPYDRNRVIPPGSEERYLNASWIQSRASGQWYIATQAPLHWTANALLSLTVAENMTPQGRQFQRVRTIVQLTPEYEGEVRKADPYFPNELDRTLLLEPEDERLASALEVRLLKRTVMKDMDCIQSELLVQPMRKYGQEFTVVHLFYTAWPDHGVPQNPESLLRFVRYAEDVNNRSEESQFQEQQPMVVGCSAGIGRTGSFIAISSLLRVAQLSNWKPQNGTGEIPVSPLSVPALSSYSEDLVVTEIDWLREQRGGMVQRREQMELIYRILSVTSSHRDCLKILI